MKLHYLPLFLAPFSLFTCKTTTPVGGGGNSATQHAYTNALVNETSPYLLQHAHNPVDWHPWGAEALAKAQSEDKILIISIGYSACHWCHVMEHESFEDTAVARVMNEHFLPIKVDREERPDVDDIYMTACHLSNGGGCGWPLNAMALPDGQPIWAGTYFPKDEWMNILNQFIALKEKNPDKMREYAEQLTEGIKQREETPIHLGDAEFKVEDVEAIMRRMVGLVDMKQGGRKPQGGRGIKFPMPDNWEFLLREYRLTADEDAKKAVETTLDHMAAGGIYDQIGGGFARYSTDERWLAPHFEKMLYDNGQLVSLYAEAYKAFGKPRYREVIQQTLGFVEREMTDKSGAFYSSLDADSEGEEGKFYVWQKEEVLALFKDETAADIFCEYYDISEKGNWEHKNILHTNHSKTLASIAKKHKLSEKEVLEIIKAGGVSLMKERDKRVRPGLDDKALTAWNALMLKGYADAYKALGVAEYKTAAVANGNFIRKEMMQADGRLNRNYKDGKSVINAFLDDYALTAEAFIALYEITFDESWLDDAKKMVDYSIVHFMDNKSGMFYYTSDLDDPLIIRKMVTDDNVIPSSNSSMAKVLFLIGTYYYEQSYIDKAERMAANMKETVTQHPQPAFFSNWAQVLSMLATAPYEVAILGDDAHAHARRMMATFQPNALFLGGKTEGSLKLLEDKLMEGETYIYVCRNKTCQRPVQKVEEALKLMR